MDDAPETRRRIGIIIAQPYREGRKAAAFSCVSPPDSHVTFPSYDDPHFEHLRKLHEKGIQAIVEVVEGVCQTEVRVPWSRWVETTPPDAPGADARAPEISPEVLKRLEDAVKETATVDVLSDDWGNLGRMDRSATVLKPFIIPGKGLTPPRKDQEEEEEEEEEEQSSPDILKLQMLQRKMMRRIHERRAAAAAAESPLQRFLRHYETRLNDLYPDEGRAFSESLKLHRVA
ncbi:uncharacterized protein LOC119586753 [Penaeus monodon]|uniref:uncharacterized protein LOC119586753 n=1 Tax=Penaeus monodon TaxID=6687 RepID=UPI0018A71BE3|nr:uncharacterized protein LOC119586753 [Penaeus monodon]